MKKNILEDFKDFNDKARKRALELSRLALAARNAAEKAKKADKVDLADKLIKKAEELEQLIAKNWNSDLPEEEPEKEQSDEDKDNSPTVDDLIRTIKTLDGDAKEGAKDAIIAALKKRGLKTESLQEALFNGKSLRELSDDEFAEEVNKIIDLISEADEDVKVIGKDDKEKRLARIKQLETDPSSIKALQQEDNVELAKDFQKKIAREKENEKYSKYRSIDQFKINFYNAINDQIEMIKVHKKDYSEINPEYEDDNIIMKADVDKNVQDEAIPIINFYFDVSGSWTNCPEAIEIGKQAVATVKDFEDRGEVKLNIYYFGDHISTDMYDYWGTGTQAWNEILQNIKATGAKNVVLMTDCDMETQAKFGPICKVDGSVWFIWNLYSYTTGGREIPKHLMGRGQNNQYAFGPYRKN